VKRFSGEANLTLAGARLRRDDLSIPRARLDQHQPGREVDGAVAERKELALSKAGDAREADEIAIGLDRLGGEELDLPPLEEAHLSMLSSGRSDAEDSLVDDLAPFAGIAQDHLQRVEHQLRGARSRPVLHFANFPLVPKDDDVASRSIAGMPDDGILIQLLEWDWAGPRDQLTGPLEDRGPYEPVSFPLRLELEHLAPSFEGIPMNRQVATRTFSVGGRRFFRLRVVFGTSPPSMTAFALAQEMLSNVQVAEEEDAP
jgi:hypothetical protein